MTPMFEKSWFVLIVQHVIKFAVRSSSSRIARLRSCCPMPRFKTKAGTRFVKARRANSSTSRKRATACHQTGPSAGSGGRDYARLQARSGPTRHMRSAAGSRRLRPAHDVRHHRSLLLESANHCETLPRWQRAARGYWDRSSSSLRVGEILAGGPAQP